MKRTDDMDGLLNHLKDYAAKLGDYLETDAGNSDRNYDRLAETAMKLNVQIENISISQLELAAEGAGAAVDAINSAVGELQRVIAEKAAVAKDLAVAQAAVSFAGAIASGNLSKIVASGQGLVSALADA